MNWPLKITTTIVLLLHSVQGFQELSLSFYFVIPTFLLCRSVLEQWRHRSYHPFIQLPAIWYGGQGVFGRGISQDGALPLPVLDPTALHPLCPTRPPSAQSGGQVWCGPPASQVQGEHHAQTRLGEKQVPGMLKSSLFVFDCMLSDFPLWPKSLCGQTYTHAGVNWTSLCMQIYSYHVTALTIIHNSF